MDNFVVSFNVVTSVVDDATSNYDLVFEVSRDGKSFFKNVVSYFGLPSVQSMKKGDKLSLLFSTVKSTLMRVSNRFGDEDGTEFGWKASGLSYKKMVDVEEVFVRLLSDLLSFGKEDKKYKS